MIGFILFFQTIFLTLSYKEVKSINVGSIKVKIENIQQTNGAVAVALYNKEDGFPFRNYIKTKRMNVQGNSLVVELTDIPYGNYAIGVLHDINDNHKMDTNFLGIPIEPYGFSNNVHPKWRAPKFYEAKFDLNSSSYSMNINVSPW